VKRSPVIVAALFIMLLVSPVALAAPDECHGGVSGSGGATSCGDEDRSIGKAVPPVANARQDLNYVSPAEQLEQLVHDRGCEFAWSRGWRQTPGGPYCVPPEPAEPGKPDYQAVARQAGLELIAAKGKVGMAPGRTLAGLETYFWLDGVGNRSAVKAEDGWRMRIEARPVAYRWDFGDGVTLDGGPGGGDDPREQGIAHVYRRAGHYPASVTVDWAISFNVDDGDTLDAAGAFTTVAASAIPVGEIRARLTG
jgi:hypothetical protein